MASTSRSAFDVDQDKVGRVFAGRRCYALDELDTVLPEYEVRMAVLASRPEGLQALVDRVAAAGVHAILNFVPKRVTPPEGCFVENTDISAKLEKLSFLARAQAIGMKRRRAGRRRTERCFFRAYCERVHCERSN